MKVEQLKSPVLIIVAAFIIEVLIYVFGDPILFGGWFRLQYIPEMTAIFFLGLLCATFKLQWKKMLALFTMIGLCSFAAVLVQRLWYNFIFTAITIALLTLVYFVVWLPLLFGYAVQKVRMGDVNNGNKNFA